MSVPDYYQPLMPYVVLKDADGFIDFIKRVFDAEEKAVHRNDDGSVMHAEFLVNGGTILFGEAGDQHPPFPAAMYLSMQKIDELYRRGFDNGAEGNMEPADRDYDRAAGFKDKWGNQWWLNWHDEAQ